MHLMATTLQARYYELCFTGEETEPQRERLSEMVSLELVFKPSVSKLTCLVLREVKRPAPGHTAAEGRARTRSLKPEAPSAQGSPVATMCPGLPQTCEHL